jgi:uncharacterized repeat protein (TIGR03803 family)
MRQVFSSPDFNFTSARKVFKLLIQMCSKKLLAVLALMVGWLSASCPAQTFTLLHAFAPLVSNTNADGDFPYAQLARSGNVLYGTTFNAGANSNGTVFAVNVDGTGFTNVHVFTVRGGPLHTNADGATPASGVVVSSNRLYGTTGAAGPLHFGTVYAMNTDGSSFTNIHVFNGNTDGNSTLGGLVLAGSRLYGNAQSGGTNGYGMIFGVNTDGSGYANLHSFAGLVGATNTDGIQPLATLAVAGTNLFGACSGGGAFGSGTLFRINTDGSGFTNLHVFSALIAGTNSDGKMPYFGGLTVNGTNLFGTTRLGGNGSNGVLYRMNFDGSGFTNLHSFTAASGFTNADGLYPFGSLFSSGNTLYGTAAGGGPTTNGTVFVINTDGSGFKVLYNFSHLVSLTNADGAVPVSVILSSNMLYGVAHTGGSGGSGAVFSLWMPPPLSLNFSAGNAVLAWPTNADGFQLQSAEDLSANGSWAPVAAPPVNANGQFVLTNSLSGGQMFYRLAR